ncbi:MAG TPA: flagellar biosynthesis protein FlhA [Smithellaceae bacterium]|jgi:flagellar biosynthesis protein FlhA|nr:flagellar biosynthesis protein FlhA [Syntrophaceae bacterium]HPV48810.1 flagellar biosynthesis protein FlhA [Smithellaceae bacterium]
MAELQAGAGRNAFLESARSSSAMIAMGVIAILMVMILPIPTFLLDILLSFSIAISIIILLMSMYVLKPLQFSVFPSVLLLVTLLRLALNVASTRLILLHGNEGTSAAGQVIQSFGTFVVGGNYVVGMVVFLVLVLINFIVITKGATRIAEVSARFTLDAMPGKQMSIDADLNAGLISDNDARRRRAEIEQESNFYGAMDGASKFVRGDAIAGILIVLINIIGGLIIGVLQKGMPVVEAARNYTLLTVGDGLVTQVPALIVSTAAGILVTRTSTTTELGDEVKSQVFTQPRAIATAAIMLFIFALIPGMPKISFILVALLVGVVAYRVVQAIARKKIQEEQLEAEEEAPVREVDVVAPLDAMGLEVGYTLIPLVDAAQGGELLVRIKSLRRQLASEMGFIMPAIHIKDNLKLKPDEYSVMLKGVEIARGSVMMGYHLVISPDEKDASVKGVATKEPAFGLPAVWVADREKDAIMAKGYVVVDPATVITTHLTELTKTYADELLGRQEVQSLVDNLEQLYPRVVKEIVPKVVPLNILHRVLQRLLRERISIRDLLTIIETIGEYAPLTKNADILTGYVRQALRRAITHQYQDQEGNITVMIMSPDIEDKISRSISHTEYESFVSPDPNVVKQMIAGLHKMVAAFTAGGLQPIVLCSPETRIHFRKILEKMMPNVVILAHNEISREANIKSLGIVE